MNAERNTLKLNFTSKISIHYSFSNLKLPSNLVLPHFCSFMQVLLEIQNDVILKSEVHVLQQEWFAHRMLIDRCFQAIK